MSAIVTKNPSATVEMAIDMLRKLSPRERLKVITVVLPEIEDDLPKNEPEEKSSKKRKSLYGLWKDLDIHLTAEDIDQARQEMWANFPREDI